MLDPETTFREGAGHGGFESGLLPSQSMLGILTVPAPAPRP
jgi:hypothetical protein